MCRVTHAQHACIPYVGNIGMMRQSLHHAARMVAVHVHCAFYLNASIMTRYDHANTAVHSPAAAPAQRPFSPTTKAGCQFTTQMPAHNCTAQCAARLQTVSARLQNMLVRHIAALQYRYKTLCTAAAVQREPIAAARAYHHGAVVLTPCHSWLCSSYPTPKQHNTHNNRQRDRSPFEKPHTERAGGFFLYTQTTSPYMRAVWLVYRCRSRA
jgi:hypothetical protein